MQPIELVYEAAVRVARPLAGMVAPFSDKLRRGVRGRRVALGELRRWAAASRDDRPLIWLHAPSVGEALMAGAILGELRRHAPEHQAIFTFFSPSAERMAARVGADWAGYLPWDTRAEMRAALDAVRPTAVAFVRTEIWPVLVHEAQRRGARVVLVNAVLAEGSSRTGWPARLLLGPAYRRLDAIGCASAADAARFGLLGVAPGRITVTGDARFDQVWQRVHALDRDTPLLRSLQRSRHPILVGGSTWPADEERLIRALVLARARGCRWQLIMAPHEPTPAHVEALERRLDTAGFAHARLPLDDEASPAVDAFVVDRVGVLADLYAVADLAWIGGGFGTAGLHSVVEPAALGVPVLCGPRHGNAQEAGRLAAAGGAEIVRNVQDAAAALCRLHTDAGARRASGAAARDFVAAHTGGARRNADLILAR